MGAVLWKGWSRSDDRITQSVSIVIGSCLKPEESGAANALDLSLDNMTPDEFRRRVALAVELTKDEPSLKRG
jgi:hypothetical protein